MIPYGKQDINQADIDAVLEVLHSDFLTQGPKVSLFENAVAKHCDAQYGVAVNSATSALHIANLALGVGKNDIVWTSPITFVATSNSALYCGASIDFVDIDLTTGNMCVDALEQKLICAKKNSCLPKVIIPVHLAGQPCNMVAIHALAQQYNFKIIEDASHAIGASYQSKPVGNCQYSDITVFSFHPVKIITSAEGGMALTNYSFLADKMNLFKSHGVTADESLMTEPSHGLWYYQQLTLGFNYRMTELQAALGLSQLNRLDEFVKKRNTLAQKYNKAFSGTDIGFLKPLNGNVSSYHLYIVMLPEILVTEHKKIITELRSNKIFAHVHYIPIHLQPYYQTLGFKQGDYIQAERYYRRAISLPLHPNLTNDEQNYIIYILKQLIDKAKQDVKHVLPNKQNRLNE